MDYTPCLFTQEDLKWLDNLMPEKKRQGRRKKKHNKRKISLWRGAKKDETTDDEDDDDDDSSRGKQDVNATAMLLAAYFHREHRGL